MAEHPTIITPPSTIGSKRFGYVVLRHVMYIVIGGIFYTSLRLRDIAGGKFLGK